MQAILLATGEANPLRPFTELIPSPMLPLANRPVMLYAVELLARQGFKDIYVSLHTLAGEIEAYFGTGRRWGVHLHYLLQRDAWGTAGALRWAKNSLCESFLVLPADALIDLDLAAAIEHHQAVHSQATVVLHRSSQEGVTRQVRLSKDGWVSKIGESYQGEPTWSDTGAYLFEPDALEHIPPRTPFDIHNQLLPAMLDAGLPVSAYQMPGYWNPLDTFHQYHTAQRVYLHSAWGNPDALGDTPGLRYPVVEGRQISPGIWIGRNQVIHPSARLAPPVCIGQNCHIGQNVELGPETVIGDHVMVDDEATISQSTVYHYTYVGQLVNIENRLVDKNLIVDIATANNLRVTDPFLLSSTPTTAMANSLSRMVNQAAGLVLLVLLSPLLLLLCLLAWISTGQAFCTSPHQRSPMRSTPETPSGEPKTFELLRFSTCRPTGKQTRLGSWLESWEGHRLLELWNVARGDMDLVGVMPLTPDEAERFGETWQQKKKEGIPGFTGLWYTQTSRASKPDEMIIADIYYLATRSLGQDFRVLFQTPRAWLKRVREASSDN